MKKNNDNFYKEYCNPFDETNNLFVRAEHLGRYLWASKYLSNKNKKYVADIACCDGYGCNILSRKIDNVFGFDRKYIKKANKLNKKSNIKYIYCDCNKTDFLKNVEVSFDAIVSFETIEHLERPENFIKSIYNNLNKEGILLLSFPNNIYEKKDENGNNLDKYHLQFFSIDTIKKLLIDNDFKIIDVLGQSYTNIIINEKTNQINKYNNYTIEELAKQIAIPSCENLKKTYSYIIIAEKK